MTFDFHGKVVLVTGAAAGLGFACAKAFTDAGATVVMTDIVQESLDKAVEELRSAGAEHAFVDVSNVHGATFALTQASGSTHNFFHHPANIATFCNAVAVAAVSTADNIFVA